MIISHTRLVKFVRENPFFTPQQGRILKAFGNEAAKCLDCYCFKCTSDCEELNGTLLPHCGTDCKRPISPIKVRKCFEF